MGEPNLLQSTTATARALIEQYMVPGAAAVDATCGNGHDAAALVRMGAGMVYAFDVQERALGRTRALFAREGLPLRRLHLIHDGHEHMCRHIEEAVRVVVFNLGYLPGGDHDIITRPETTTAAVRAACSLLETGGLICVTIYSGHAGGCAERDALLEMSAGLDAGSWHVLRLLAHNQTGTAPQLLLLTRKRGGREPLDRRERT
ncbi:MAG: class I SAM-dependent methyltransferase [Anaerovoracaceae bacterium]|jgi:hypothetical protein